MLMVGVGRHHRLEAISQKPPGKLQAESLGLGRRHLAGGVGVDEMVALHSLQLVPAALGVQHIPAGRLRPAVQSGA